MTQHDDAVAFVIEFLAHLSQCHCHSRNCVHVGPSLQGREDCSVDLLLKIVFYVLPLFVGPLHSTSVEDEATPVGIA